MQCLNLYQLPKIYELANFYTVTLRICNNVACTCEYSTSLSCILDENWPANQGQRCQILLTYFYVAPLQLMNDNWMKTFRMSDLRYTITIEFNINHLQIFMHSKEYSACLTFLMFPGSGGCAAKAESEQREEEEGTNRNTPTTFVCLLFF